MMNDDIVEPRLRLPRRPVKGSQRTAAQGRLAAHSETVRRAGLPRDKLSITPHNAQEDTSDARARGRVHCTCCRLDVQVDSFRVADDRIGMLHNDKVHSFDQRLNQRTRSFN